MGFIINSFIRILKYYKIKVFTTYNDDGSVILDTKPTNSELDILLTRLKYDDVEILDKSGRLIKPVRKRCCVPFEYKNNRYLRIALNRDDYAKKINVIDRALKDFYSTHII